jgi:hypothetical protein
MDVRRNKWNLTTKRELRTTFASHEEANYNGDTENHPEFRINEINESSRLRINLNLVCLFFAKTITLDAASIRRILTSWVSHTLPPIKVWANKITFTQVAIKLFTN